MARQVPVFSACLLFLIGFVPNVAAFDGGLNAEKERIAAVYIEGHFSDDIADIACSGVLLDEQTAVTASHCLYQREGQARAKEAMVCIGRQKPFNQPGEACFTSDEFTIFPTGPGQLSGVATIRLAEPIPLAFLDLEKITPIKRAKELELLKALAAKAQLEIPVKLVSFGSRSLSYPTQAKKNVLLSRHLSWDPISHHWMVRKYGTAMLDNDAGAALLVKLANRWYLMGVLARAQPSYFYTAEPFFDPCAPPQPPPPQPSILKTSDYFFVSFNLGKCRSQACRKTFYRFSEKFIDKAYERRDIDLLYRLAWRHGDKTSLDSPDLRLLRLAARLGHGEAMYDLAVLYGQGRFLPKDPQLAKKWFEKALAHRSPNALYDAAMKQSAQLRTTYLTSAARMGFAPAQRELGKLNADDPKTYYRWLMRAARQGDAEAQYLIAEAFLDGYGVRADNYIARQWMRFAAGQGFQPAIAYLDTHPAPLADIYDAELANE